VPIICNKSEEGNKPLIRSLDDNWLEVFKRLSEGTEESFDSSKDPFWQTYHLLGISFRQYLFHELRADEYLT
jgi:hypothetical protein